MLETPVSFGPIPKLCWPLFVLRIYGNSKGERLILQIHEKNEKLEVTASIWEDGTMLVSVCHVAWTFTVWADLFQSRPLD